MRRDNIFSVLAGRVETGDLNAQGELRRQLEPEMVRIVRRVVVRGAGPSSVDRRIVAEARRVGLDAELADTEAGERLIHAVAHAVSSLLVAGLRPRPVDRRRAEETVCN